MEHLLNVFNALSQITVDKIIIYLRLSRSENGEPVEVVLARHERILQEFAMKTFGIKIPEHNIYREVVSGETIEERKEIKKVFERINDKKEGIEGVLVVEPSRLTRGDLEDCGFLMKNFKISNTLIITPYKTYNLNQHNDFKMLQMELMQGSEYLGYTKTILGRGRLLSLSEGKWINSQAPLGYNRYKLPKEKGYILTINEEEAPLVRLIFEYLKEHGTKETANYLNEQGYRTKKGKLWDYKKVKKLVKNEAYIGLVTWEKRPVIKEMSKNGKVIKKRPINENYLTFQGRHKALISVEDFNFVNDKLKNNPYPKVKYSTDLMNPFASLLYCSECGKVLIRRRNYNKNKVKRERVYEIDKEALSTLIRNQKNKLGLSAKDIAERVGMSVTSVYTWVKTNAEKNYYTDEFSNKWFDIKKVLQIETTEFDEMITLYKSIPQNHDYLGCFNSYCSCVASHYDIVEKKILDQLKSELERFNYYIDNYEQETKIMILNNNKKIAKINEEISVIKTRLKNARRNFNEDKITFEEYQEDKFDYEKEIQILENERAKLEFEDEKEVIIQYKKLIPNLKKCVENFHKIKSIEEQNQLLKSIIKRIEYTKKINLAKNPNAENDLTLKVVLKI